MIIVDYSMRGGSHPNPRIDAFETEIAKASLDIFSKSIFFQRKGLKWTYNWMYYSNLYASQNPEVLKLLYEEEIYPDFIEIETSTHCNLKCTMCEHTYWKEKNQNMTYKQFLHIVNQFPKLKWIGLTGIGESYLNPDFEKMMTEVKRRGIFIENFDNFVLLNEERAKKLIEIKIDKLYVSLDAATKETYEKIRVGANFDEVIKNVITLDRLKKKMKSYEPELWFHFIVSKDNKHEMIEYLELINNLKIDCKTVQFTILLHPYKEIKEKFVEVTDEEKQKIIQRGKELGLNVTFNMNTGCKNPLSVCSLWMMPFIFVDGTVIPCCSMNEQNDRPWQVETKLGNIFEEDFRKIWYGEKYTNMRKQLSQNKQCAQCSRCFLYK